MVKVLCPYRSHFRSGQARSWCISTLARRHYSLFLPVLLGLSACGAPNVRIAQPPLDLLQCADEPTAPSLPERDGTDATQLARDVATLSYILGLRSAWGDCSSRLAGIRAWSEEVR